MNSWIKVFLFVFTINHFLAPGKSQRSCNNASIRKVQVGNITSKFVPVLDLESSKFNLTVRIKWDVSMPQGVKLDGFLYHLQDSEVTTSQTTIPAVNLCNLGSQHYWVNTDAPSCSNQSSIGGVDCVEGSGEPRICPITYTSLGSSCKGTGNRYIEQWGYRSTPPSVQELTFNIDFHQPYAISILAYYREFVNTLSGTSNSNTETLAIVDCPTLLSQSGNLNYVEATELCCDENIPHVLSRNVTIVQMSIDFFDDSTSVFIKWLPPLLTENLDKFRINYNSADGRITNKQHITVNKSEGLLLSAEEKSQLANCDNTSDYYTTILSGIKPNNTYTIAIDTEYRDPTHVEFNCDHGLCNQRVEFRVPEMNPCDPSYGYCHELAHCEAEDKSGVTTFNATCICPPHYTGNGINSSIKFMEGDGCVKIDYCSQLTPCVQTASCRNNLSFPPETHCMCLQGYFGDGLKGGAGCTQSSVVALGISIPLLLILVVVAALVVRKIYIKKQREKDFAWEQFISNDNLREFSRINQLESDNDEVVWLPTFGDKWELDRNHLKVGEVIGRGNYGVVNAGVYGIKIEDGSLEETKVAVKTVKEGSDEDFRIKEFLTEIGFMINVGSHPNILQVYGCCTTQKPVLLITDYLKYGDLLHFLWDSREPSICDVDPIYHVTEKSLYKIGRQVAQGMDYLTKSRIIHGDLAARNILVGEELLCKISDFGLANDVYRHGIIEGQSERCVPYKWISPERMMAGKVPITSKSDVWSFGNLIFEMITLGCMPHPDVATEDLLEMLENGYRMKKPSTCSDDMYSIMTKCWKWRPSSRPTFSAILHLIDDATKKSATRTYVNIIDLVDELNKPVYDEEISEQKQKNIFAKESILEIELDHLNQEKSKV